MGNGKNNTTNSSSSFFAQAKDRLQSIDIETSGLDEKKNFIWSMGRAGKGGTKEFFVTPPSEKEYQSLLDNKIFNIEGYHDAYKESVRTAKDVPLNKAINSLFDQVDKESIILVQNLNFENKFIGEALRGDAGKNIKDMFPDAKDPSSGRILNTSKEVTDLRHKAMRKEALLGRTKNPEARKNILNDISSTYNKLLGEYDSSFRRKSGAVTVELMDVSKAMFSLAAQKNQVSSQHIGSGLTVDFLKKALFAGTGAEKHTAAADAEDQIKIFNRMGQLYRKLDTNTLSGEDLKTFARIKAAQPFESSRQFISGLRNTLEEIQNKGYTKLLDPELVGYQPKAKVTADPEKARAHVVERYINRGTKGLDVENFSNEMNGKKLDEQISFLKNQEAIFKDKSTRRLAGTVGMAEQVRDAMPNMKHKKKIAGGLLAASLYAMTSNGEDGKIDFEEKKQEMMYARSNDRTFSMYSKPEVYHGTGLYLWENATRHHEY
ncbi:MAG: hypothetical protein DRQ78_04125 [Epsilonproteobacteria bacterium]|nr:MAG: hypothetical protein DRQ78_04125 [Campylobacterota bacterium]